MGITIENFPVYGGAADISGVYTYVRDIRSTKEKNGNFSLNYIAFFEKDISGSTQRLDVKSYNDISSNMYYDTWSSSYAHLKTKLDNLSLTYNDS